MLKDSLKAVMVIMLFVSYDVVMAADKQPKKEKQPQKECGSKSKCKEMSNCQEAKFYLNECGVSKLDRDKDGVPCESLCN